MDESPPARAPDPRVGGPLSREDALAILDRGAALLASGDFAAAGDHYGRIIGFDDAAITAAALLGLGEVRYRLDNEEAAVATWSAVLKLGETPSTYAAWRNIAAAQVRAGNLGGAIEAYRQADRRAPQEDKAEIANRLGWLAKETGNPKAAGRYFAAGRGDSPWLSLSVAIIALTSIVSLTATYSTDGAPILDALLLDKAAVAAGEYWRLLTVTLVHADIIHLFFNMYALYLAGPIIERWYGRGRFLVLYLLLAAAGSTASFVFGDGQYAVGASGAIFGLFGMLLAAGRLHNPVDRQGRALLGQLGMIILINLAFGFASGGQIDNAAHLGGLIAGLWLGAFILPSGVPTLSSLWHQPTLTPGVAARTGASPLVELIGVAVVVALVATGIAIGTPEWGGTIGRFDPAGQLVAIARDVR